MSSGIEAVRTADGSMTLYAPAFGEHYHSIHGALQESQHVFMQAGWQQVQADPVSVFEMGFGTGLNALLTLLAAGGRTVQYTAVEAFPLAGDQWRSLNYAGLLGPAGAAGLEALHQAPWGQATEIRPGFTLHKAACRLEDFEPAAQFDLVYYDAFAPGSQPELWTEAVMARIAAWMRPGACFVTYCAKGSVRRALLAAGLQAERLPGPPGKREMLRAWKR
ncbi:MAG: tRNA (5-methylaminomethyl-2-thiouridine)(34)-methyltransferase MnmD [Bacteroidia bacterium]|nr:tRNA (5-methylaminomethyl-2-thiouridine)(34)-methyltransferase MnmD [Bacteroidia bacterium]